MNNRIRLKEFENRKINLNFKNSNEITLTTIENIRRELENSLSYMDYYIYFYDDNLNDYCWIDVEGVNEGWIHTNEELKTKEDIIDTLKKAFNYSLDAINAHSDDNNITCFIVEEYKKKLYHIVELSKDGTERTDFSIYLELEEN
uniref:Uncharacterized protein n=1 Tax=Mammaliicoccus phage MSShimriz1 TaxID=3230127 RepID=A0AAU8GTI8_9VIRU